MAPVGRKETEDSTSMTQWSAVYDLSERKLAVSIRRDYARRFAFSLDGIGGAAK